MTALRLIAVASIAMILLISVDASRADSSPPTFPLGSGTWTLVSTPKFGADLAGTFTLIYSNKLNTTSDGIIYGVIHNSIGQTVAWESTTLNMAAGQVGTCYLLVEGLVPPGNYTESIFAASLSGIAISNSTSVSFSLR